MEEEIVDDKHFWKMLCAENPEIEENMIHLKILKWLLKIVLYRLNVCVPFKLIC